jgi:hypothetical protein
MKLGRVTRRERKEGWSQGRTREGNEDRVMRGEDGRDEG